MACPNGVAKVGWAYILLEFLIHIQILEYLDQNGKEQLLKAEGLLATCIQHEIDHLNGVLFIDYLSKLKKSFILKKLLKAKKEDVSDHINF